MMMMMKMTYSLQTFSVTAAVVALAVVICLNSLLYIRTCARAHVHTSTNLKKN